MDPTTIGPGMVGAPMNIVPPQMQAAMGQPPHLGILNGQAAPPNPQMGNNQQLMQQAQQLMKGPGQPPQMPQIQMARPVGAQGIDPQKLLAAMQANRLMSL